MCFYKVLLFCCFLHVSFTNCANIQIIACQVKCENANNTNSLKCLEDCANSFVHINKSNSSHSSPKLKIICQTVYQMVNGAKAAISLYIKNFSYSASSIIFIWSSRKSQDKDWKTTKWTRKHHVFINDLYMTSKYKFKVDVVDIEYLISDEFVSQWFTTATYAMDDIAPPTSLTVQNFKSNLETLSAAISWIPPKERFCSYDIHWFSPDSQKLGHRRILMVENKHPFQATMSGILYDTVYTVSVASMIGTSRKSEDTEDLIFRSPTCHQINSFNFTICGPTKVQNFQKELEYIQGNISAKFSWGQPKWTSGNNIISGFKLNMKRRINFLLGSAIKMHSIELDLDPNVTNVEIYDLIENSVYDVTIMAFSVGGSGKKAQLEVRVSGIEADKNGPISDDYTIEIVIGITVSIALLICCIVSVIAIKTKRFKGKKYDGIQDESPKSRKNNPVNMIYPNEKNGYEVDIRRIVKTKIIGEGSFGIVYSGHLVMKSSLRRVAIKMLKDTSTKHNKEKLCEEIELVKSVGKHPHIVSIVACCTTSDKPCLLMEYCALGNLKNYLLKARNHEVIETSDNFEQKCGVSYFDLISFARQISSGMEFLSSNKIVHRDLAARNVLVKNKKIVKITDFGLAKDVYEQGHYQINTEKKLPIKWMAIESIFDHVYTTKSDVWSFGILLWEIMSLGATPYPGVVGLELIPLLRDGHRLSKPKNCIDEVYDLMKLCWQTKPSTRPSFTEIKRYLEAIIEATITYLNLESDVSTNEIEKSNYTNLKRSTSLMIMSHKKSTRNIFGRSFSEILLK